MWRTYAEYIVKQWHGNQQIKSEVYDLNNEEVEADKYGIDFQLLLFHFNQNKSSFKPFFVLLSLGH